MKKMLVMIFIVIVVSACLGNIADADMAKVGNGEYRSAKSTTYTVMPMGEERIQMNYDQTGAVVSAPMTSPLYNATFWSIGSLQAIKGKFEGKGSVLFTNPAGDKIYGIAEFGGILGDSYKATVNFVGGTGACTGIQGMVKFEGTPGLKPSKKGIGNGISVGTVSWKIP